MKPHTDAEAPANPQPYTLDCSVKEFLLQRLRHAEEDQKNEEEARVRVIMENVLFYRGQHELFVTRDLRIESSYEDEDEDEPIKHNWYAHMVEGKAKEWEAAKPRIEITGRPSHDYRLEGAGRLAQAIDEYLREDTIKAHLRQSEAKFGMLCKVYYRYSEIVHDDADEKATRIRVPITERREQFIGAVYQCGQCRTEWSDGITGGCPCGAGPEAQQQLAAPYPYEVDVQVAEREEVMPTLSHRSVNPLLVKLDQRARRLPDSDYLLFETVERRYLLESDPRFQHIDIRKVDTTSNLPARLRAYLELERTSAGVDAFAYAGGERLHGETRADELVRVRRFWMLPRMYAHYRARADEEICGITFRAGQRIGDALPMGLLMIVLGESELAVLEPESKNKRWAGAPFTLDPTTYHGKGTEDWNSIQMSIDDKATLAASHFDRTAAPSEVIDDRVIDSDELDGSTGKRLHVKETAPQDKSAKDAVHVVQAGQLGADFQNFFAAEPAIFRELAGVGREVVGFNDPNNKTARGREMAAAASSSLLIPSLALRAEEVEVETTMQNLEFFQQHAADEDFDLFEPEFGAEAIKTFREINLRRRLKVRAVPGSWVPVTKDQELQNAEDFAVKYLTPAASGMMPMSFVRHAANLYGIPVSVFEPERDAKLAQARLARLRPWADRAFQSGATRLSPPAYEMMLDSIINQPEFVPSAVMENHQVHMDFYADQWKSMYDDRRVNPVLLDLIDKMFGAHVTAMAAAEFKFNELKMKAQAPIAAAQQVMQETTSDEAMATQEDQAAVQSVNDRQVKDEDAVRQLALTAAEQELAVQ